MFTYGENNSAEKCEQHGKIPSSTFEFILVKTSFVIANKDANVDTRDNPESKDTSQTLVKGSTTQQNPSQAEIIQEQAFRVPCSRCCHQKPGFCIEDIRYPKPDIGSKPGDPGTSPNYPHLR